MPFPSKNQLEIINHRGMPLVIVAGPGTGKTRTIVQRMIELLKEDRNREVSFITFTRTSRKDTEVKLKKQFGKDIFFHTNQIFPRTSTLHTFAKRLVHKYGQLISRNNNFSVLIEDQGERDLVIHEIIDDLKLDSSYQDISVAIKMKRAGLKWPDRISLAVPVQKKIISYFDRLLDLYNSFDMEGLVISACDILDSSDSLLPQIFLQVDEYQDLNPYDQLFIEKLIHQKESQIVVVGDDAQSIYGFRYANPEGITKLWNSNNWKKIGLSDSFRLPPHILNASQQLISRTGYVGASLNPKPNDGKKIHTFQCTRSEYQVAIVALHIKNLITKMQQQSRLKLNYSNFLILCPTKLFAEQTFNRFNNEFGIPALFPQRSHIPENFWRLILFLRVLNDFDPLALRQLLELFGLPKEEISLLRNDSIKNKINFYDKCMVYRNPIIEKLKEVLDSVQISIGSKTCFIEALQNIEELDLSEDLNQFLTSIINERGFVPQFGEIIQTIYEKYSILDSEMINLEEDKVLITTMHNSKGLEAEYTYCLWMNDKFMPFPTRDEVEERRVLYVAMTRPLTNLYFTFHEEYIPGRGLMKIEAMSCFLQEIIDYLKIIRVDASFLKNPNSFNNI
ncbi:MAG: ATP-dependent helicase [Ignavibacteriales bacterium]|nr:ATP-dependent helicase [Ignavibacteriales bacterium]